MRASESSSARIGVPCGIAGLPFSWIDPPENQILGQKRRDSAQGNTHRRTATVMILRSSCRIAALASSQQRLEGDPERGSIHCGPCFQVSLVHLSKIPQKSFNSPGESLGILKNLYRQLLKNKPSKILQRSLKNPSKIPQGSLKSIGRIFIGNF